MISLTVTAELGSDIDSVVNAMIDLANIVKVNVRCRFNDVLIIACPGDDLRSIVDSFMWQVGKSRPRVATSARRYPQPPIGNEDAK